MSKNLQEQAICCICGDLIEMSYHNETGSFDSKSYWACSNHTQEEWDKYCINEEVE